MAELCPAPESFPGAGTGAERAGRGQRGGASSCLSSLPEDPVSTSLLSLPPSHMSVSPCESRDLRFQLSPLEGHQYGVRFTLAMSWVGRSVPAHPPAPGPHLCGLTLAVCLHPLQLSPVPLLACLLPSSSDVGPTPSAPPSLLPSLHPLN